MIAHIREWQSRFLEASVRLGVEPQLKERAELFTALFEKDLPAQAKVLDIGGHWGFYAAPLERRGHETIILDVVKPGIQHAPVVIYDGQKMPFADKSFDVSLLITVLHHIEDQKTVLEEAKRVTRSKIIVVEDLYHHAVGRLWTILRDQVYNFEWFGHPRGFRTEAGWRDYFQSLHLEVQRFEAVKTRLCGLSILNGLFVLEVKG